MPVPYCCDPCHQARRYSPEVRRAYHAGVASQLQRVPVGIPTFRSTRTEKWFRRALTLDVWLSGAMVVLYGLGALLVLAFCAFGVYLVA